MSYLPVIDSLSGKQHGRCHHGQDDTEQEPCGNVGVKMPPEIHAAHELDHDENRTA